MRQKFLIPYIATVLIVLFSAYSSTNSKSSLTNIVMIYADDLGYGNLSCYGPTKVQTPNIDQLAADGLSFSDAHAAAAVCSPSRYGLITGRYPLRRNYWGAVSGLNDDLTIDASCITIASLLKVVAYSTACVGKWHLGLGVDEPDYNKVLKPGPLELGFDYAYYIAICKLFDSIIKQIEQIK